MDATKWERLARRQVRLNRMAALAPELEAIPERDPAYELPATDDDTTAIVPLTDTDRLTWRRMLAVRPALACLSDYLDWRALGAQLCR